MKLPIIKQLVNFAEENDEDFLLETAETLESICEVPSLKDEELNLIGELISNIYGALEVSNEIRNGAPKKEAMNSFMSRVLSSIDK
ncbi:DUF6952 family protein [Flagellimonas iocasae]|uniref:DUF6952 family protein n=1 Tax=Flagellimonas iocasae TaxID=2055905 RepID=A0ABW4XTK3_9FLAO